MALLVPDVGEVELLKRMLNFSATGDVQLYLYTSNTTPAEDDVVCSYTLSTVAGGTTVLVLTGTNWTVQTNTGTTTGSHAQVTFTFTGAEASIYGYVVTNAAGAILLWAERFTDGPYAIPSGGGSVKITPQIQLA